jgi:hypothetical protein
MTVRDVIILAVVACIVITFMKGKNGMGVVGLLIAIVAVVGAIRLAKPDSYWARKFYGEHKRRRATARFGVPPANRLSAPTTPVQAGWYPDPEGQGARWWDGQSWTEHRQA